ncbi:MAG TPA: hypothetical protein PKL77_10455, partial [Candidatus Omnitrophota bacterium]|nr:hypothetical protein [Candidatus Omnitrophota bacterium]
DRYNGRQAMLAVYADVEPAQQKLSEAANKAEQTYKEISGLEKKGEAMTAADKKDLAAKTKEYNAQLANAATLTAELREAWEASVKKHAGDKDINGTGTVAASKAHSNALRFEEEKSKAQAALAAKGSAVDYERAMRDAYYGRIADIRNELKDTGVVRTQVDTKKLTEEAASLEVVASYINDVALPFEKAVHEANTYAKAIPELRPTSSRAINSFFGRTIDFWQMRQHGAQEALDKDSLKFPALVRSVAQEKLEDLKKKDTLTAGDKKDSAAFEALLTKVTGTTGNALDQVAQAALKNRIARHLSDVLAAGSMIPAYKHAWDQQIVSFRTWQAKVARQQAQARQELARRRTAAQGLGDLAGARQLTQEQVQGLAKAAEARKQQDDAAAAQRSGDMLQSKPTFSTPAATHETVTVPEATKVSAPVETPKAGVTPVPEAPKVAVTPAPAVSPASVSVETPKVAVAPAPVDISALRARDGVTAASVAQAAIEESYTARMTSAERAQRPAQYGFDSAASRQKAIERVKTDADFRALMDWQYNRATAYKQDLRDDARKLLGLQDAVVAPGTVTEHQAAGDKAAIADKPAQTTAQAAEARSTVGVGLSTTTMGMSPLLSIPWAVFGATEPVDSNPVEAKTPAEVSRTAVAASIPVTASIPAPSAVAVPVAQGAGNTTTAVSAPTVASTVVPVGQAAPQGQGVTPVGTSVSTGKPEEAQHDVVLEPQARTYYDGVDAAYKEKRFDDVIKTTESADIAKLPEGARAQVYVRRALALQETGKLQDARRTYLEGVVYADLDFDLAARMLAQARYLEDKLMASAPEAERASIVQSFDFNLNRALDTFHQRVAARESENQDLSLTTRRIDLAARDLDTQDAETAHYGKLLDEMRRHAIRPNERLIINVGTRGANSVESSLFGQLLADGSGVVVQKVEDSFLVFAPSSDSDFPVVVGFSAQGVDAMSLVERIFTQHQDFNTRQVMAVLKASVDQEKHTVNVEKALQIAGNADQLKAATEAPLMPVVSYPGDPGTLNSVFTFDLALYVEADLVDNDFSRASRVLDVFRQIYAKNPTAFKGFANAYVAEAGEFKVSEERYEAGPNAWLGISILTYIARQTTPEAQAEAKKAYQPIAVAIGTWLTSSKMQDIDGGIHRGWKRAYVGEQGKGQMRDLDMLEHSTEHNIDAYAFLKMLARVTNESKYADASVKVATWVKTVAYDKKSGHFYRGVLSDGKPDTVPALDAQVWAITGLGAATLLDKSIGGISIDPQTLLNYVEDNFRVTVPYVKEDGTVVQITGYDFTDAATAVQERNRGSDPKHPIRMVSTEWTTYVAAAYMEMNRYYRQAGKVSEADKAYSKYVEIMLGTGRDARGLRDIQDADGNLPYATSANIPTGHGWNTPYSDKSMAGTLAYVIARTQDNPFTLETELGGREGDRAAGLSEDLPYNFDKEFAPVDKSILGLRYVESHVAIARQNFAMLLSGMRKSIQDAQNLSGAEKNELLGLVATLGQPAFNSLMSVKLGPLNFGIVPGGRGFKFIETFNIARGFVENGFSLSLSNVLGVITLASNILGFIHEGDWKHLQAEGGVNAPRRDSGFFNFLEALTLDTMDIRRARFFYNPRLIDGIFQTRGHAAVTQVIDPFSNIMDKVFGKGSGKKYPAYVMWGKVQIQLALEALNNTSDQVDYIDVQRPDMSWYDLLKPYFGEDATTATATEKSWLQDRLERGTLALSFRVDNRPEARVDGKPLTELLFVADIYHSIADQATMKIAYETETQMRDLGQWREERNVIMRKPSIRDIRRAADYARGLTTTGVALDNRTGDVAVLTPEQALRQTYRGTVLTFSDGAFQTFDGKPLLGQADLDLQGRVIETGIDVSLVKALISLHRVGRQTVPRVDNGERTYHILTPEEALTSTEVLTQDAHVTLKGTNQTVSIPAGRVITHDQRYVQHSTYMLGNQPIAFVDNVTVNVPRALVMGAERGWAINDGADYQRAMLYLGTQKLEGPATMRIAGHDVALTRGTTLAWGKVAVTKADGTVVFEDVTWDSGKQGANGKPGIVPAIVEYAPEPFVRGEVVSHATEFVSWLATSAGIDFTARLTPDVRKVLSDLVAGSPVVSSDSLRQYNEYLRKVSAFAYSQEAMANADAFAGAFQKYMQSRGQADADIWAQKSLVHAQLSVDAWEWVQNVMHNTPSAIDPTQPVPQDPKVAKYLADARTALADVRKTLGATASAPQTLLDSMQGLSKSIQGMIKSRQNIRVKVEELTAMGEKIFDLEALRRTVLSGMAAANIPEEMRQAANEYVDQQLARGALPYVFSRAELTAMTQMDKPASNLRSFLFDGLLSNQAYVRGLFKGVDLYTSTVQLSDTLSSKYTGVMIDLAQTPHLAATLGIEHRENAWVKWVDKNGDFQPQDNEYEPVSNHALALLGNINYVNGGMALGFSGLAVLAPRNEGGMNVYELNFSQELQDGFKLDLQAGSMDAGAQGTTTGSLPVFFDTYETGWVRQVFGIKYSMLSGREYRFAEVGLTKALDDKGSSLRFFAQLFSDTVTASGSTTNLEDNFATDFGYSRSGTMMGIEGATVIGNNLRLNGRFAFGSGTQLSLTLGNDDFSIGGYADSLYKLNGVSATVPLGDARVNFNFNNITGFGASVNFPLLAQKMRLNVGPVQGVPFSTDPLSVNGFDVFLPRQTRGPPEATTTLTPRRVDVVGDNKIKITIWDNKQKAWRTEGFIQDLGITVKVEDKDVRILRFSSADDIVLRNVGIDPATGKE